MARSTDPDRSSARDGAVDEHSAAMGERPDPAVTLDEVADLGDVAPPDTPDDPIPQQQPGGVRVDGDLVAGAERPEAAEGLSGLSDERFDGLGGIPEAGPGLDAPGLAADPGGFLDSLADDGLTDAVPDLDTLVDEAPFDGRTADAYDGAGQSGPGVRGSDAWEGMVSDTPGGGALPGLKAMRDAYAAAEKDIVEFSGGTYDPDSAGNTSTVAGQYLSSIGLGKQKGAADAGTPDAGTPDAAAPGGSAAAGPNPEFTEAWKDAPDPTPSAWESFTGRTVSAEYEEFVNKQAALHEKYPSASHLEPQAPAAGSGSTSPPASGGANPTEDYAPGEGPVDPEHLEHLHLTSGGTFEAATAIDAFAEATDDVNPNPMAEAYADPAEYADYSGTTEQYLEGEGSAVPDVAGVEDLPDPEDAAAPYVDEVDAG